MSERAYCPAAGHDLFLPLYDPLLRLFGADRVYRPLVDQAELQPGHAALDIGCGTGGVTLLIKRLHPQVDVTGLDPDPKALARAARKAGRAGVTIRFDRGFADAMPYGDAAFDRVFSSLMFHHLPRDAKPAALTEARRVLKPGGSFEFVDFAGSAHGFLAQLFHGHQPMGSIEDDRMLRRLKESGFADARRVANPDTAFGRVAFYRAVR